MSRAGLLALMRFLAPKPTRYFDKPLDHDRERKAPKHYTRHQGPRERARRVRQLATGHRRTP